MQLVTSGSLDVLTTSLRSGYFSLLSSQLREKIFTVPLGSRCTWARSPSYLYSIVNGCPLSLLSTSLIFLVGLASMGDTGTPTMRQQTRCRRCRGCVSRFETRMDRLLHSEKARFTAISAAAHLASLGSLWCALATALVPPSSAIACTRRLFASGVSCRMMLSSISWTDLSSSCTISSSTSTSTSTASTSTSTSTTFTSVFSAFSAFSAFSVALEAFFNSALSTTSSSSSSHTAASASSATSRRTACISVPCPAPSCSCCSAAACASATRTVCWAVPMRSLPCSARTMNFASLPWHFTISALITSTLRDCALSPFICVICRNCSSTKRAARGLGLATKERVFWLARLMSATVPRSPSVA
mmetsp:Transcript_35559/g.78953  ORF Transcript_35559/g.78953 Transcript_35559/m.78953 type:complete len:359 (-) Transcript_35559:706-1782(-)